MSVVIEEGQTKTVASETVTIGPTETTTVSSGGTLSVGGVLKVEGNLVSEGRTKVTDSVFRVRGVLQVSGNLVVETLTQVFPNMQASGTDVDASTAPLQFSVRNLRGDALDSDRIDAPLTRSRTLLSSAIDTDGSATSLSRVRSLVGSGIDVGTSTGVAARTRTLTSTATDTDTSGIALLRVRELETSATDSDIADASATRIRTLVSSSVDSETSTARLLPRSRERNPVDTIEDLLAQSLTVDVDLLSDVPPKARENRVDDAVYVDQTTQGTRTRFSAIDKEQEEDENARVLVYSLDSAQADILTERILAILQDYMRDNYSLTTWHDIEPEATFDARNQKTVRKTDHTVYQIDVALHRVRKAKR